MNQLSLDLFSESDNKPNFAERIRKQFNNQIAVYNLIDLMAEFNDLQSRPDILWRLTKKRLVKDGFQSDQNVIKLPTAANDGKSYKMPYASAEVCLRIIQSIPSDRAEPIRRWLAQLGVERIEEAANPILGVDRANKRYVQEQARRGVSETDAVTTLRDRLDSIDGFKQLMITVSEKTDRPNYAQLVNAEYLSIFGEVASTLRAILNTKSIRDALPAMMLSYVRTAELTCQEVLRHADRLTMVEVVDIMRGVAIPLGNQLQQTCQLLGISPITGQKLLARKTN